MSLLGRQIAVNGLTFNVYVEGEGEPVLLLHGFPDSNYVWRRVIPHLVQAGYKVIAPDQRGYGESAAPVGRQHYTIDQIASDAVGILDALGIEKAQLVGHDWGAAIAWYLAGAHSHRFERCAVIGVGHPKAYVAAGWEQKRKGWYTLFFQLVGVAEKLIRAGDWALARKALGPHPELEHWIADLSRPGRLTAGINWYRANFLGLITARFPRARIPVLGIWSTDDLALAEDQMIRSAAYVDATWQYERFDGIGHWIPLDAPEKLSDVLIGFLSAK